MSVRLGLGRTGLRRGALCALVLGAVGFVPEQDARAAFTPFMSTKQEKKVGAGEHPKILEAYGGAYKGDRQAGYIAQVGGTIVSNSDLPATEFTFTLLNSDVVNAFALPGGYIYISRQLLGLMNDEAELSSVLGHEAGHVTDRHTAKRYNRSIFSQIAAMGAGILTGSNQIAGLVSQVGQLETLSYSRKQEYKADEIGVRYITKAGYDPYAAADMLRSLDQQTRLDAKIAGVNIDAVPGWQRTHPVTADRVSRALKLAKDSGVQVGAKARNNERFLAAIDGLVMDDDPEQGFIRGRTFSHPILGLTFTAPEGYTLQNGTSQLVAQGPNQSAVIFSGGKLDKGGLDGVNQQVWSALGQQILGVQIASPGRSSSRTINGIPAAVLAGRTRAQNGAAVDLGVVSYQWAQNSVYYFAIITPAEVTAQVDQGLKTMIDSFRRLSKPEADKLIERRITLVTVKPGDTAESLAARMGYEDNRLERFMVLNALTNASDLKVGRKVKLITYSRG